MDQLIWWVLVCGWGCEVDLERAHGWRAQAALERRWSDFAGSRNPEHPSFQQGYASRQDCLAALAAALPAGVRPYAHWVGGEPRFRITTEHHGDWVELRNNANNAHLRYGCFSASPAPDTRASQD